MRLAGNILVSLAGLGGVLFVVTYGLMAPWWRSWAGRSLMSLGFAIAAACSLVTISLWWPDIPWRPWLRIVLYGLAAAATWIAFATVVVSQIRRRRP